MRKVEMDMLRAIVRQRDFKGGNTVVRWSNINGTPRADVTLHGNHIATVWTPVGGVPMLEIRTSWRTVTTKSRLNALLRLCWDSTTDYTPNIMQDKWVWYFREANGQWTEFGIAGRHVPIGKYEAFWWAKYVNG